MVVWLLQDSRKSILRSSRDCYSEQIVNPSPSSRKDLATHSRTFQDSIGTVLMNNILETFVQLSQDYHSQDYLATVPRQRVTAAAQSAAADHVEYNKQTASGGAA